MKALTLTFLPLLSSFTLLVTVACGGSTGNDGKPSPSPVSDAVATNVTPVNGGSTPGLTLAKATDTSNPTTIPSTSPDSKPATKTHTGFFWPTGYEYRGVNNWLNAGFNCPDPTKFYKGGGYADGLYSLGVDIAQDEGHPEGSMLNAPVVAIADGYVVDVQLRASTGYTNGLERVGNTGVVVEHYLSDGQPFTAVYGDVVTDITVGGQVTAGVAFAQVGPQDRPHLHFGIFAGVATSIKDRNTLKEMPCPRDGQNPETNGSVDPVAWITMRSPGPIPSQLTTTARMFGLDDFPNLLMQPTDVDSAFTVTDVIPFTIAMGEQALGIPFADEKLSASLKADAPPVAGAYNAVTANGTTIQAMVTLFADESSARRGFRIVADYDTRQKNNDRLPGPRKEVNTHSLGDESYGLYGIVSNISISVCMWRVRNAIVILAGLGSLTETALVDMAHNMLAHQR